MPAPRRKGGFRKLARVSGQHVGALAIKVYVCRGCGTHYQGKRPDQCVNKTCGRMDFSKFDSKGEANHYAELRLRESSGLISDLQTQVRFDLLAYGPKGMAGKVAQYVADFVYIRDGEQVIADYKGAITDVAALKLKWMAAMGKPVLIITNQGTIK